MTEIVKQSSFLQQLSKHLTHMIRMKITTLEIRTYNMVPRFNIYTVIWSLYTQRVYLYKMLIKEFTMQPPMIKPCPECGGTRVWTQVKTYYYFKLVQPWRCVSLFSGKSSESNTQAITCLNCGYTALYATEPQNLVPDK